MESIQDRPPISPGEKAPDFSLPALDGARPVSLSDYVGREPLFLALSIGLWCPFCRRSIAQIGLIQSRLATLGVQSLCIVATEVENARLYFRFRPTRVRLAADPDLTTHRAYGLPKPAPTPEFLSDLDAVRINPEGRFPEPLPVREAAEIYTRLDGYVENETDRKEIERQWPQSKGQFLIDRDGIIRWANIECLRDGLAGIGRFPAAEEIVAAAGELVRH
jgi:peroxiredoxin